MNYDGVNYKKEYPNYLVTDEILLYRLADAGFLDKLCRVSPSKKVEGTRVWFFDKDPDVWEIIKKYKAEMREQANNSKQEDAAE